MFGVACYAAIDKQNLLQIRGVLGHAVLAKHRWFMQES